jgi:fructokinase
MTNIPRVVGIGELLWDLLPSGPRLGGTVTNFSVFCARLGNRADLVSSVGDDEYGRAARTSLPQPNLELAQLQICPYPTGTVGVAFSADNQPSYTFPPDVAWDFIRLTPDLLQVAAGADAVSFGTLAQRHAVSRSTIRTFVEATAPRCVRVCDVNLRMPYCTPEVLGWSMAHATLIKVSDEELPQVFALLSELESGKVEAPASPKAAADSLLALFPGCSLVATSLGAHGCLITTRQDACEHPGFPVKLVDSVGAGDAFTAGLVHAYLRGASLAQMAEIGNLCGSFVASQPGATPELPPALIQRIAALLSPTDR